MNRIYMNEKSLTIRILAKLLKALSLSVLWRQKPFVIGITGSVGKTTAKDMIAHILQRHENVWVTQKNYNNEIGVPLTVLCVERSINSINGVIHICIKWLWAMCTKKYPKVLIVEMGVDRPGDMDYLLSIVKPDIAVLTAVSHAHSEFFTSVEDIAQEKQKIVTKMKVTGKAIVNADDKHVISVAKKTHAKIITYGTSDLAHYSASDIEVCFGKHNVTGLSFKLNYKGKVVPVRLKNVIARHMIYAALSALAVADILHINVVEAARDITDFVASPGRMRLLPGKDDTLIIDDTYNASPKAMNAAIATLHAAPAYRKIAVLGDMRELGSVSQKAHENVAEKILKGHIDAVFLVGQQMKYAYKKLYEHKKNIYHFDTSEDVVDAVAAFIEQGDLVLVKGSRGIHMEYIVRKIAQDRTQTL